MNPLYPVVDQAGTISPNLALACRACNVRKADHLDGRDDLTGNISKLFHPRRDEWRVHSWLENETGKIHGHTPIGRATVARLQMNSGFQTEARRQWMRLGLFP